MDLGPSGLGTAALIHGDVTANATPPLEIVVVLLLVLLVFATTLVLGLAASGTLLGVALARTTQDPGERSALPRGNRLLLALGAVVLTTFTSLLVLAFGGVLGDAAYGGGPANGVLGLLVVLGTAATWGWWNGTRRRYDGPRPAR